MSESTREQYCGLEILQPHSNCTLGQYRSISHKDWLQSSLLTENDSPTNQSSTATEVKKGFVAFDIPLDGSQATLLDNVLKKPLPKRLRHLEPLGHAPQITTEMLMEKLEKAEEKRQKVSVPSHFYLSLLFSVTQG
ncbi:hypothetical protein FBUS_05062 [Fasciolopsis buskii]|uniref:Uncharacterized protein n=1 Tax=Fasciolopsis buskii TaxID=27845 RepID=A0A8E0VM77_9TREM|nr:hypothetical protein FBUS_05062 [Fasciolopsis buski]